MKLEFSWQIRAKCSNIIFFNPSSGSIAVTCGQTDRQTDMTKPVVGFRSLRRRLKWNQIQNVTHAGDALTWLDLL
jgi:hypothetical protein